MMAYTPMDELRQIHADLRATFASGVTLPVEWRQAQLRQLVKMLKENHKAFADAVHQDLGRPYMETYTVEITGTIARANGAAEMLPGWSATADLTGVVAGPYKAWSPNTVKRPKGVGLVLAPWNYPIFLSLVPLLGAIAAGCCCVIKLSEISPHFSETMKEILPRYLDGRAFRVVLGAVPETTVLLKLKWDHIFYTGNTSVGRIVARAAAEHLTPVTLELGGKCPVIIDPKYDMDVAARRILMAKISNAGQICVSPDYVLVPSPALPALLTALRTALKQFFPSGALHPTRPSANGQPAASPSPSKSQPDSSQSTYSHIVSLAHFRRLQKLLGETRGRVVIGGEADEGSLGMEPTVLLMGALKMGEGGWGGEGEGVEGDVLMREEIFGPILPIVEVGSVREAVEFVRAREHPLAIYPFTEDQAVKDLIDNTTTSGSIIYNSCFLQMAVPELPYGGVGESGSGRCNLPYVMDEFSYVRSSMDIPAALDQHLSVFYPPYTEEGLKMVNADVFSNE